MKIKCNVVDVLTSSPEAVLDPDDCVIIGVKENDRVRIGGPKGEVTVLLVTSNLPRVDYSTAQALDVYTVMVNRKIVCDKAGFDALMARIAK